MPGRSFPARSTASSVLTDTTELSRFDRALFKLESLLNLLGGLTLFALVGLAVVHVLSRKFFNAPVPGYVDWTQQFMALFAFLGLAYTQREGGHIRMDIVVGSLRGRSLWVAEWLSVLFFNHKSELEKFVRLHPLPEASILEITGNKWNLNEWLKKNGFPSARTRKIGQGWDREYPVLLKPVFGIGGKGIQLIQDPDELKKITADVHAFQEKYFLQEHIVGHDIDISFFAVNGKIIYHTIQRGLISGKMIYSKGIEFVRNRELLELVSEIVASLNYTGIAHLDFLYSSEKDAYILIDFNARYWSSVQGSRAMGINFPLLVVAWTLTQKVETLDYRTGYYYFSSTAMKTIISNLFSKTKYPVKLKGTQLLYIFKDPLPELMFLLGKLWKACKIPGYHQT